jgi:hypothetical protein
MSSRDSVERAFSGEGGGGRVGLQRVPMMSRPPPILLELGPDSDVAVRERDRGELCCVGCCLRHGGDAFVAATPREMRRHLLLHREEGGCVPERAIDELSGSGIQGAR